VFDSVGHDKLGCLN